MFEDDAGWPLPPQHWAYFILGCQAHEDAEDVFSINWIETESRQTMFATLVLEEDTMHLGWDGLMAGALDKTGVHEQPIPPIDGCQTGGQVPD